MDPTITYRAPPTVAKFMESQAFARCLMGPFGSGKSSGCVIELLRRAAAQRVHDGKRRTRFAVVRNSYRELYDTAKRTVEDWLPSHIRTWSESNASMLVRFNDVECELLFRALDTPDDVKKLLSLELTGAWINEAKEIPRAIFDALWGRVTRFPATRHGGSNWHGIILDTNPPDSDHWIYKVFEEDRPEEHAIFHQPSGLAVDAENIENLEDGRTNDEGLPIYYARMLIGKTREWVDVYVHGKYGFVRDGKPVYPEYQDEMHTLKAAPEITSQDLYLGMDFGLTPAIVVCQRVADQWQAVQEFFSQDIGAARFSAIVAAELRARYPNAEFTGWGDPAGSQRSQVDEQTPYEVVHAAGLPIEPVDTNDFVLRREAVAGALSRLTLGGKPGLVISPECRQLRKAMAGGYCFRRVRVSGDERYRDAPEKNLYSHIAEALQYAMLGEGEDHRALHPRSTGAFVPKYKVKPSIKHRRMA